MTAAHEPDPALCQNFAQQNQGVWRRRFGWATAAILMVAGIFTQLAIGSGQELKRQLDNNSALVRSHTRIAEDIRPFLLVFFIALVAFLYLERRKRLAGGAEQVSMKSSVLMGTFGATLVFGAASIYWIARIGHTGAKAVWQPKMAHESRENRNGTQEIPRANTSRESGENGG